jgi:predicted nuclease with TOPRIM domain
MKKLKKWLVVIGLFIGMVLIILLNKYDGEDGIKNRMKRRKLKMDDLKKKESELNEKIDARDGSVFELREELESIRKAKKNIKDTVDEEIKNQTDDEKVKLFNELMKDL